MFERVGWNLALLLKSVAEECFHRSKCVLIREDKLIAMCLIGKCLKNINKKKKLRKKSTSTTLTGVSCLRNSHTWDAQVKKTWQKSTWSCAPSPAAEGQTVRRAALDRRWPASVACDSQSGLSSQFGSLTSYSVGKENKNVNFRVFILWI